MKNAKKERKKSKRPLNLVNLFLKIGKALNLHRWITERETHTHITQTQTQKEREKLTHNLHSTRKKKKEEEAGIFTNKQRDL